MLVLTLAVQSAVIWHVCFSNTDASGWYGGMTGWIKRSRVWLPVGPWLRNNSGQVVHTPVFLSPSSVTWYQSVEGDALQLCGFKASEKR